MTALRTATRFVNAPVSAPLSLSARRTSPSSKGIVANAVPSHDDHAHGGPDPSSRVGIPPVWGSAVGRGVSKTNVNASPFAPSRRAFSSTPAIARDPISVPDFSKYRASSVGTNRNLSYFMIGSLGMLTAAASKASVVDLIGTLSASADVLALAKIEVAMGSIPEGKNVVLKWRGKPVFIRHRTQSEIDEANAVDVGSLRDPQEDSARTQQPEWLVMVGVCTHLGCVPIGEAGDYGGWFCPCHGSHYDISGRIRKGPAPLNLEVPVYSIDGDASVITVG